MESRPIISPTYIKLTMANHENFKLTGALGNASQNIHPPDLAPQWLAHLTTNPLARVRSWMKAGSAQLIQLFILPNGKVLAHAVAARSCGRSSHNIGLWACGGN